MANQFPFVRALAIDGVPLPISAVVRAMYKETIDTSAPQLVLVLHDKDHIITDNYKLAEGSTITAELSGGDDDGNGAFTSDFTVVMAPSLVAKGQLEVSCLHASIYALKQPAIKPNFYSNKAPQAIVSDLIPLDVARNQFFAVVNDYHILSGRSAGKTLRQMFAENAMTAFVSRNQLHVYGLSELGVGAPEYTFESGYVSSVDRRMINPVKSGQKELFRLAKSCRGAGFNLTKGAIAGSAAAPFKITALSEAQALENLNKYILPVLEFECAGDEVLQPAQRVKAIMHRYLQDQISDESIPDNLFITQVVHYQDGTVYRSKVELGVVV